MSASNAKNDTTTSDREIVATRIFDAPRTLVFDAFTDPQHIAQWWGPNGFTSTISEMDVRPGGHWRLVMHGPDGTDYNNHIVFVEVVRPKRLVFKHMPEKGTEPGNHETTVMFEEEDGGAKTKLTMSLVFTSPAAREFVAIKYKAVEGLDQTLGRLREYLTGQTVRQ